MGLSAAAAPALNAGAQGFAAGVEIAGMTTQYRRASVHPAWARAVTMAWLALACTLARPAPAADAGQDTLLRIMRTGRVVLGVRDNAKPLTFADGAGGHMGYHMDICLRVVAAIQQRFDLSALKVVTVPTTLATRFALLNNRTVDIECGHNAVNASALQQALVSHATLVSQTRVMVREPLKGLALPELGGRPVGVVVGSSAVPALRSLTRNAALKVIEVPGRHSAEVFGLLEQGRVDAIAFSTIYLTTYRSQAADPTRYVILDPVLRTEPLGLMVRLEDERLHGLTNEVLAGMMRSGDMARLYERWFVKPLPGLPDGLGLPMSPATQRLFASPGIETQDL
jgi:glutamate/aspartate transport system substrate-binding protein